MQYRNVLNFNLGLLFLFLVAGCSSLYKTSHELFIDMMNDYIKLDKTILELEAYSGKGIASREFRNDVVVLQSGDQEQHFSLPNIYGRFCHYYLLIDKDTNKVKSWEFDQHKSNPKENCGVSG